MGRGRGGVENDVDDVPYSEFVEAIGVVHAVGMPMAFKNVD